MKTVFSLDLLDDGFDGGALVELCLQLGSQFGSLRVRVAEECDLESDEAEVSSTDLVARAVRSAVCREPLFELVEDFADGLL